MAFSPKHKIVAGALTTLGAAALAVTLAVPGAAAQTDSTKTPNREARMAKMRDMSQRPSFEAHAEQMAAKLGVSVDQLRSARGEFTKEALRERITSGDWSAERAERLRAYRENTGAAGQDRQFPFLRGARGQSQGEKRELTAEMREQLRERFESLKQGDGARKGFQRSER
jgi:hypothetical protein